MRTALCHFNLKITDLQGQGRKGEGLAVLLLILRVRTCMRMQVPLAMVDCIRLHVLLRVLLVQLLEPMLVMMFLVLWQRLVLLVLVVLLRHVSLEPLLFRRWSWSLLTDRHPARANAGPARAEFATVRRPEVESLLESCEIALRSSLIY